MGARVALEWSVLAVGLRVVRASGGAGHASTYYCDADHVGWQGGSGSDHAVAPEPHRVSIWMVLVFVVFYAIVMGLIAFLYSLMRKGPAKDYAEALAGGQIQASVPQRLGKGNDEGDVLSDTSSDDDDLTLDADIEGSGTSSGPRDMDSTGWLTKDLNAVHRENGLDSALYLLHCKQMATYCASQLATMGLVLICVYRFGGEMDEDAPLSMFAWSYANIADDSNARFVPVLASWWCIASVVAFTVWKQRQMDGFKQNVDEETGSGARSLHTLWIKGLPADALEQGLIDFLEQHFEGQVRSAKLVWDVNQLGHNVRRRRNLTIKVNKLQEQLAGGSGSEDKVLSKIESLKDELVKLKQVEPLLRGKPLRCAGSAFITFERTEDCAAFRNKLRSDDSAGGFPLDELLGTATWRSQMAPRPSEIYWENFGLTSSQRRSNKAKAVLATMGMFGAFIFVSLGAVWCIGFDYMFYLYGMSAKQWAIDFLCPQKHAVGSFVWYGIFAMTFIILFLVLEEEMAPIIKFISKYDSPKTKSIKQSVYLGKCYWFYVIYHMLLSTTVLGFLAANVDVDPDMFIDARRGAIKLYVEAVGAFHQHRVFLTVGVIDMLHLLEGTSYFTRKGHTLTVQEERKFSSAEEQDEEEENTALDKFFCDKFDFSRNYGETIGVFTSICYYQVMHPTILICGAIYYFVKLHVDKYQICNQYSKSRAQYGRRARTTTTYLLWSMAIGQVGNAVYYLWLVEDTVVGLLMLCGVVVAFGLLGAYKLKPAKMTTSHVAKRAKSPASGTKDSALLPAVGGKDGFPEPPYAPPKPTDLSVGVELVKMASTRVEVVNPMMED